MGDFNFRVDEIFQCVLDKMGAGKHDHAYENFIKWCIKYFQLSNMEIYLIKSALEKNCYSAESVYLWNKGTETVQKENCSLKGTLADKKWIGDHKEWNYRTGMHLFKISPLEAEWFEQHKVLIATTFQAISTTLARFSELQRMPPPAKKESKLG